MSSHRVFSFLLLTLGPAALSHGEVLRLNLSSAIERALESNFAVRIERLEPRIAREGLRAAQGAFDPELRSTYRYEHQSSDFSEVDEETASLSIGLGSTLPWGTEWEVGLEANDRTTPFDLQTGSALDAVSSFAGITITQPLLRDAGRVGAYTEVRVAREAVRSSWESFRARVMDLVTDTVIAYHDLYFAGENLRIARENRDLALKLLEDNRKRVESGAMAPIDLIQAESEAALREDAVIRARLFLDQARNALKGLIWDDPRSVLAVELEIEPPAEPGWFDPDMARDLAIALRERPAYRASQAGLQIRRLEAGRLERDALPRLDLVGSVGRLGLDRSLEESLDRAVGDGETAYSIGAVISIPFPNRTRSALKAQAYLRRNQAELALGELEQTIRLELDDAATRLQTDWERIQAARTARNLAEQALRAEERKLQAGTSSTFVVLRLQGDLAGAEIREINALVDYTVSLSQYHRIRGRILDVFGIRLDRGESSHPPS
jgi:outer membrane protein TolC